MIKLESSPSVSARTTLRIQSQSVASVVITTEKARSQDAKGQWNDDATKLRQVVRFSGPDGAAELSGIVNEADAVDAGTQFAAVVLVEISTVGLPAFEAGRKGRSIAGVSLVGVLEIWGAAGKRLWSAGNVAGIEPSAASKAMDEKGKIA